MGPAKAAQAIPHTHDLARALHAWPARCRLRLCYPAVLPQSRRRSHWERGADTGDTHLGTRGSMPGAHWATPQHTPTAGRPHAPTGRPAAPTGSMPSSHCTTTGHRRPPVGGRGHFRSSETGETHSIRPHQLKSKSATGPPACGSLASAAVRRPRSRSRRSPPIQSRA